MANNFAVDVGFGRTKGKAKRPTGEMLEVDLRSVVSDFKPVKFSMGGDDGKRLIIGYKGKQYAVDEAALKQGTPQATIDENRAISEEGMVLLMAALVRLTEDNFDPFETLNLVVGLPVLYFATLKDEYVKAVKGMHVVETYNMDGSKRYRKCFNVDGVKVLPQPIGTAYDLLCTDNGTMGQKEKELSAGNIGIVDIGYNTLDLARLDNLEYIGHSSTSFPMIGMFTVFKELSDQIRSHYRVTVEPEKLEPAYLSGELKIEGKIVQIEELKSIAIERAVGLIVSRVKTAWPERWEMDHIAISGGGSYDLGAFLAAELGRQAVIVKQPSWANVNGYLKYAQRIWK